MLQVKIYMLPILQNSIRIVCTYVLSLFGWLGYKCIRMYTSTPDCTILHTNVYNGTGTYVYTYALMQHFCQGVVTACLCQCRIIICLIDCLIEFQIRTYMHTYMHILQLLY